MPWLRSHPAVKRNAVALAVGVLLAVGTWLSQLTGPGSAMLRGVDATIQDTVLSSRPAGSTVKPNEDPRNFITIVAIDDRTLAELGAYNGGYPRVYYAQLIHNLLVAPPRVIALDLGFFEPTPDDGQLAAALEQARSLPMPTSVILGAVGLPDPGQSGAGFGRALLPVPELASRADIALANLAPDERGTIRSMPLMANVAGVERPTLGLAAVARYLRRPSFVDAEPDSHTLQLAGRSFPVESNLALRINFLGPPSRAYQSDSTFRVISFVDVLRGRIDPRVWRGGMVFVGALGATGLADDFWTPVSNGSNKMAGVEIHANLAATLFSTQFLQDVSVPRQLAIFVGLAALVALLVANLRASLAIISVLAVLVAFVVAELWLLYERDWLLPLAGPLLATVLGIIAVTVERILSDRAYQERHDALTGLPNRRWLVEKIDRRCRRRPASGALLLLDLDQFRHLNDTLGHLIGDGLLREVAARMLRAVGGAGTVARLGGDEFAVWLPLADAESASTLTVRILRGFRSPFFVGKRDVPLSSSIGIALFPEHGTDSQTLLRRAELAMYAAKRSRVGYSTFSAELDRQSADRFSLAADLPTAVANDELVLYCQPKMDCRSRGMAGVEVLVRWVHPQLGLLQPDRFIALAEESGSIGLITRWVLDAALRQARAWLDIGLEVPIAVNLSAYDFDDAALPTYVSQRLAHWRVPAWLLSIEVTETAVLADPARATDVLARLAGIGVRASLDDFGTGYSSLSAIQQLVLHEIKIDRSFVRDMTLEHRNRAIVRSTVELGHSLGLSVVAEGVEDSATFQLLGELGCDLAQGFLFAQPMPVADLARWISAAGVLPTRVTPAAA